MGTVPFKHRFDYCQCLMVLRHPESDWNEVLIEPEAWMLCLAAVTGARTKHWDTWQAARRDIALQKKYP